MSQAWQFWPGVGRNFVNPAYEHYKRVVEKNQQEEARLAAHEEDMKIVGRELGAKHGLKFIGTSRQHPPGTSVPKNPRLQWMVPPKSVISLGFEVASGIAGWRVRQQLAEGVVLSGKLSTGWSVWLEEKDLGNITKIFKPEVLPPAEDRNREQSDGALANFGGHYRVMGMTGNSQYWVVRPDGSLREPDEDRGRGYAQKYKGSEGDKRWDVVSPDELAISWSKSNTAAAHQFIVNKLPVNGATPAQIQIAKSLQAEIAERFDGATGCSGRMSPSIGNGWELVNEIEVPVEENTKPVAEGGERASAEQIQTLLDRFKK